MREDVAWALHTERTDGGTLLRPAGAIDLETSPELRATGTTALESNPHLVVDLSEVTFLDSTGLGVLVTLWHQARAAGGRFQVVRPSGAAARILAITGVDILFDEE